MGLGIEGGIAQLTRAWVEALAAATDEKLIDGVSIVSYLDETEPPLPRPLEITIADRSRWRVTANLFLAMARHPGSAVIADHALLARVLAQLPGPLRPTYAVLVHGNELEPNQNLPIRRALARARFVVAVSETSRLKVEQMIGSTGNARISVVPPGVSAARVTEWDSITARPGEPMVLIAGRMKTTDPGKGHDALLRSWPTVVGQFPDAQLCIAGDGDLRADLERLAVRLGVSESVRFVGHVSARELGILFRTAQIFAMPSRQEGFGLVYAEAMYAGLPCIGSTADAAVDVITTGVDGILVPYADSGALAQAICGLLADPKDRIEMGRAARAKYERSFSPEAFYDRFVPAVMTLFE